MGIKEWERTGKKGLNWNNVMKDIKREIGAMVGRTDKFKLRCLHI